MAVIGNSSTQQAFTPAVDYFSGTGSATAFTLSRPVASVAQVQVVVNNVAQNPSSAYTISSNTITFTSAPSSGTNNIYVYYTSPITDVIAPGQGTVTATSMASSTGTGAGVFQTSPTITTPVISSLSSASATALTLQSAGTTAVTIDTSQNVGIGTTSPNNRLHLNTSASSIAITLQASGGYGYLYNDGTYVGLASDAGSTGVKFRVARAAPDNAATINSSGYVTMPYQPGFRAGLDTSTAIASGGIFQFTSVSGSGKFNDGGYNPSSGRFTCPVAGRYLFLVEIIIQDLPNNTDMTDMAYPYINASQAGYSNRRAVYVSGTTGTSGYYVDTVFAIYKLAANDIVDVRAKTAYTQHGNANYSIFQGYLLG